MTSSEDKQLGYFFCKPDEKSNDSDVENTVISAKRFVNKVIFYLWNDIFKDYAFELDCCKMGNSKEGNDAVVYFAQFFVNDGKEVNVDVLANFFEKLVKNSEDPLVVKCSGGEGSTPAGDAPAEAAVEEEPAGAEVAVRASQD